MNSTTESPKVPKYMTGSDTSFEQIIVTGKWIGFDLQDADKVFDTALYTKNIGSLGKKEKAASFIVQFPKSIAS